MFGPGEKRQREYYDSEGRKKKKKNFSSQESTFATKDRTSIATESRQWGLWWCNGDRRAPLNTWLGTCVSGKTTLTGKEVTYEYSNSTDDSFYLAMVPFR